MSQPSAAPLSDSPLPRSVKPTLRRPPSPSATDRRSFQLAPTGRVIVTSSLRRSRMASRSFLSFASFPTALSILRSRGRGAGARAPGRADQRPGGENDQS